MCQLLGMNCNVPTDICFSFAGFRARGGLTDHHRDGWGIAFFEGSGVRLFVDPVASADSPVAELVRHYPIRSLNVVAHIRKATQGAPGLENTHPFQREMWGRYWVFAHNGNLKGFEPELSGRFMPVGRTDSEFAFCYLLDRLAQAFPHGTEDVTALHQVLRALSIEIGQLGEFNFLLADGRSLFAHASSRLCYIVRQAPFATAHLADEDLSIDFNEFTTPDDRVAIITTTPLTVDEEWTPVAAGNLLVFVDGQPVAVGDTRTVAQNFPAPAGTAD